VAVGGGDLNWERIPLTRANLGYDVNDVNLELERYRTRACGHGMGVSVNPLLVTLGSNFHVVHLFTPKLILCVPGTHSQ